MRFPILAAAAAMLMLACSEAPQAQQVVTGVHQAAVVAQPAPAEVQPAAAPAQQAAAAGVSGSAKIPAQQTPTGRCGRPGVPPALCPVP